jgi:phosphoribosyl-AMP cyclohydrolase
LKAVTQDELDWEKMGGLIPVIAQEAGTKAVITLAYTDREALERTLETGYAHYFRRSHGKVMMKGVTSGNIQEITEILVDCDNDSLVFLVNQTGPACHLGEGSCFHRKLIVPSG